MELQQPGAVGTQQGAAAPALNDVILLPGARFARPADDTARGGLLTRIAFGISEGSGPKDAEARDAALQRLLSVADVISACVALVLAVPIAGSDRLTPAAIAILPIVIVASRFLRLHARDELVLAKTTLNEAPALFHLATLYALVTYIGQDAFVDGHLGAGQGLALWAAFLVSSVVFRSGVRRFGVRYAPPERCLIIGDAEAIDTIREKLLIGGANMNVQVVAGITVDMLPGGEETRQLLAQIVQEQCVHRLIVAVSDLEGDRLLSLVRDMKALGVKVTIKPRLFDVVGSAVVFDDVHGSLFLGVRRFGLTVQQRRVKRAIDVAGSALLLLAAAPLLGLFAALIKLDSRGPVLFRQIRVGRDGRHFRIYKFRTMVADAEERKAALAGRVDRQGLFKLVDDPRVTRFGRLLRRTSLDELPQLFNVLRGEMSLVGPRPLIPVEDEMVGGWHRRRLHLDPGMTGLWQVLGSSRIPLREMLALDYLYIVNWSVWQDVQIMLRTVPFVLRRRGV